MNILKTFGNILLLLIFHSYLLNNFLTFVYNLDGIVLFAVFYGFLVNVAYGLFERLNQDIALKIGDDFMVSSLPYRKRTSTRRVYRAPASYNVEARCNMNYYAVLVSSNTFVC